MIRYLWKYKLSPTAFLEAVPAFANNYLRTRPWRQLLLGVPALLLTVCCGATYLLSSEARQTGTLATHYRAHVERAVAADEMDQAETHLARLLTLSDDPQKESLDFAKLVYTANDGDSRPDLLVPPAADSQEPATGPGTSALIRAIAIAQNLAPRLSRTPGYQPAHVFLADFWQARQPQSDTTRVLGLQHRVQAAPDDVRIALELGRTVHDLGFPQEALKALERHKADPDALLQIALSWEALGKPKRAQQALDKAAQTYATQLQQHPEDMAIREKLSRVLLATGNSLEGVLIFAEGLKDSVTPEASDRLIQRYSWWLSSIPSNSVAAQMSQLQLALQWGLTPADELSLESATLTTTTGESITLPGPVVALHKALRSGEGDWLIPLLLGTAAASSDDLVKGTALLRTSQTIVPDHPVVANNLAWTLHQQYLQQSPAPAEGSADSLLTEAARLAAAGVAMAPEEAHFRATRGIIAVTQQNWSLASEDLEYAVASGLNTAAIRQARNRIRQHAVEAAAADASSDEKEESEAPSP